MSYTRGQFCIALLNALGNKNPTQATVNFMLGWSIEESGHNLSGAARYNLWNTTQQLPGSTFFNVLSPGVGVQNYTSFSQGISANAQTLNNGLYRSLVQALRTNDSNSLGVTGPISAGVTRDLYTWVNGPSGGPNPSYVNIIVALARNPGNSANDLAVGNVGGVTITPPSQNNQGPGAITITPPSQQNTPPANPLSGFLGTLQNLIGSGAGSGTGTGGNIPPPINIGGDIGNVFTKSAALFGYGNTVQAPNILDQVHQTLVDTPGFYGIALALDEAEQFPGFINLTSGPFDAIGGIRSVGATIGDNALPFIIRAGLVWLGYIIVLALLLKVVLGVAEQVAPLVEAAALAA